MEVRDLQGNVVRENDRVAGAFRVGNVAVLRTGVIRGFGERGNKLTVRVAWDHDSTKRHLNGVLTDPIVGEIDAELVRFVKIVY